MLALLIFLVFTIGKFAFKKFGNEPFGEMENKTTLLVMILLGEIYALELLVSPLPVAAQSRGSGGRASRVRRSTIPGWAPPPSRQLRDRASTG